MDELSDYRQRIGLFNISVTRKSKKTVKRRKGKADNVRKPCKSILKRRSINRRRKLRIQNDQRRKRIYDSKLENFSPTVSKSTTAHSQNSLLFRILSLLIIVSTCLFLNNTMEKVNVTVWSKMHNGISRGDSRLMRTELLMANMTKQQFQTKSSLTWYYTEVVSSGLKNSLLVSIQGASENLGIFWNTNYYHLNLNDSLTEYPCFQIKSMSTLSQRIDMWRTCEQRLPFRTFRRQLVFRCSWCRDRVWTYCMLQIHHYMKFFWVFRPENIQLWFFIKPLLDILYCCKILIKRTQRNINSPIRKLQDYKSPSSNASIQIGFLGFRNHEICCACDQFCLRGCYYLLGNAGCHMYNGNPEDSIEIKKLHRELAEKLANKIAPCVTGRWQKFENMVQVYLSTVEIHSCKSFYDVFNKLSEKKLISEGNYQLLSEIFEKVELSDCCDIVTRYSELIQEERAKSQNEQPQPGTSGLQNKESGSPCDEDYIKIYPSPKQVINENTTEFTVITGSNVYITTRCPVGKDDAFEISKVEGTYRGYSYGSSLSFIHCIGSVQESDTGKYFWKVKNSSENRNHGSFILAVISEKSQVSTTPVQITDTEYSSLCKTTVSEVINSCSQKDVMTLYYTLDGNKEWFYLAKALLPRVDPALFESLRWHKRGNPKDGPTEYIFVELFMAENTIFGKIVKYIAESKEENVKNLLKIPLFIAHYETCSHCDDIAKVRN